MAATTILFKNEKAPCGRIVEGEHFCEKDDEGLVTDDLFYACGCRSIRHEYHDGSVVRQVVTHDGTVLTDDLIAEHHA
jgi:hypothetical protein